MKNLILVGTLEAESNAGQDGSVPHDEISFDDIKVIAMGTVIVQFIEQLEENGKRFGIPGMAALTLDFTP
jgi:hypothetical protein